LYEIFAMDGRGAVHFKGLKSAADPNAIRHIFLLCQFESSLLRSWWYCSINVFVRPHPNEMAEHPLRWWDPCAVGTQVPERRQREVAFEF
jgi:hypothetical protein